MRRFEYSRHVIDRECERENLAIHGAAGWELVAVVPSQLARWSLYYFKRELL